MALILTHKPSLYVPVSYDIFAQLMARVGCISTAYMSGNGHASGQKDQDHRSDKAHQSWRGPMISAVDTIRHTDPMIQ